MAYRLTENELAQTGADWRNGSRPHIERAPLPIEKARKSAISLIAPVAFRTGAKLAQTGAHWRNTGPVRQCASYPPKGGLTGRRLAHLPGTVRNWRKERWEAKQAAQGGRA